MKNFKVHETKDTKKPTKRMYENVYIDENMTLLKGGPMASLAACDELRSDLGDSKLTRIAVISYDEEA